MTSCNSLFQMLWAIVRLLWNIQPNHPFILVLPNQSWYMNLTFLALFFTSIQLPSLVGLMGLAVPRRLVQSFMLDLVPRNEYSVYESRIDSSNFFPWIFRICCILRFPRKHDSADITVLLPPVDCTNTVPLPSLDSSRLSSTPVCVPISSRPYFFTCIGIL
jgi:hypothetical protein